MRREIQRFLSLLGAGAMFALAVMVLPASSVWAEERVQEVPPSPESPRGSLWAYFDATRAGRWDEAARYLALSGSQRADGAELAKRLKGVIDANHWIDLETLSDEPSGRLDDHLPAELETVGEVQFGKRSEMLRLVRRHDDKGNYWAFSSSTVARIDDWYEALPDRRLRDAVESLGIEALIRTGPFELLWWQWLVLPVVLAVAWLVGKVLGRLSGTVLGVVASRLLHLESRRFVAFAAIPLAVIWAAALVGAASSHLVLTEPAQRFVDGGIAAAMILAMFWLLWRSARAFVDLALQSNWAANRASARSLIVVGGNLARGLILVIAVLAMLGALGYPVGTMLAGLGIGGVALAFGAQKTLENLFGSVALAIDQPFRVGDFVQVDNLLGTVEDIGLRSTRIRTLDRTLVSFPNGKLADQRLESFDARDRMRLSATLGLEYGATREQLLNVLAGLRSVLSRHPAIWPDPIVVSFLGFGESSLDIEVMAWFQVPTWDAFRRCREEVLLDFMSVVEQAGCSFAFPTRTVHVVSPEGRSGDGIAGQHRSDETL